MRKLQRTEGSSSAQAPASRSSGISRSFLMPPLTRPLAFSTCPLVCGCATEAYDMLIPRPSQKSWNYLEMKFDPLLVMIVVRHAEPVDYGLKELHGSFTHLVGNGHIFDPLGELVDCDQEVD